MTAHCPHGDDCVNSRHDPPVADVYGPDANAAYLAALSPERVRALCEELLRRRAGDDLTAETERLGLYDDR